MRLGAGLTHRGYLLLRKLQSSAVEFGDIVLSQQRIYKIARGARARRAPLHPRRAPYGRHWRDFPEGLFVVGGRLRAPFNYIFPVKHSRLEGAEQSQRRLRRPRGSWPSAPSLPTPLADRHRLTIERGVVSNYSRNASK